MPDVIDCGRRPRSRFSACFAFLVFIAATSVSGQDRPSYTIPRLEAEIAVDGRLDEPAWADALVFELAYETRPGENVEPPVRTECRLFFTASHFYYGCHAWDDPEAIRARYTDRDQSIGLDDSIGIALDPFDNQQSVFIFDVNPLGIQNDRIYSEVSQSQDDSWDAIWDAAGRIVADGFVVEVEIPFTSLRFPRAEGVQTWSFNFRRYQPREVFRRIAVTPYDRNNECRLCQGAALVGFEQVEPGRDLEITPTLTGRAHEERETIDDPLVSEDPEAELGLTVKWGITPNMTFVGTINPDFSQVEADVAQIDVNTQFALFFPERRTFFVENSQIFETPIQAVYTRTLADPVWGLKLTGQEGRHGVGLFIVEDETTNLLIPGSQGSDLDALEENSLGTVGRYRFDLGGASSVGLLVTDREGEGDYFNRALGVDGKIRATNNDTIVFQLLGSQTRYTDEIVDEYDQPEGTFEDYAYFVEYERNTRNWRASVELFDHGEDFRADLGFVPRVDARGGEAFGRYEWFGDSEDWLTNAEVGGGIFHTEQQNGDLLTQGGFVFGGWQGQMQSRMWGGVNIREQVFEGESFDLTRLWINTGFQPSGSFEAWVRLEYGDAIDFANVQPGDQISISPGVSFNPGRHLRSTLTHQFRSLDVEGGNLFEVNLTELRLVYQFNARSFLRTIVQYNEVDRDPTLYDDPEDLLEHEADVFAQLLYAYRLGPRTAIWAGYSPAWREENESTLVETSNTFFAKISYSWQP